MEKDKKTIKILVTGSTGRIGKMLVSYLSSEGYLVDSRRIELSHDSSELKKAVSGADVIIHLASVTGVDDPKCDQNVVMVRNVLKHINKSQQIIFTSSIEAFGGTDRSIAVIEDRPNPKTRYGKSKLECEKEIVNMAREIGFNYSILRIGNVIFDESDYKLKGLLLEIFGKYEICPIGVVAVVRVIDKQVGSKENTVGFAAGEAVSIAEWNGKSVDKILGILAKPVGMIFSMLKIGGVWRYLSATGSPYRRYDQQILERL